jgi:GTP cyclohydrolase II
LLTNNPQKINSLRDHGIEVAGRVPLVATSNTHNERYLRAKHERAGHLDLAETSGGG